MFTARKITQEDVGRLLSDLHSVESGRFTKIELVPIDNRWQFDVNLIPMHTFSRGMLEASMTSGYLHDQGWDKVFQKQAA